MRIGIISDSHGNSMAIEQAVDMAGAVDCWLHAGDLVEDAEYLALLTQVKVINVAGNCDWPAGNVPDELLVELGNWKIFLAHGHNYGVKRDIKAFRQAAVDRGAQIAVYGHTHVSDITRDGQCLVINPGSVSHPRDGKGQSFMVLELTETEAEVKHFYL